VFRTDDEAFFARIEALIRAFVPQARLVRLDVPPVAGAALEGLNRIGFRDATARETARARLLDAMRSWEP
jgi:hypothetical protein